MTKVITISYNGWIQVDADQARYQSADSGEIKTAEEWLKLGRDLNELMLCNFEEIYGEALDGHDEFDSEVEDE